MPSVKNIDRGPRGIHVKDVGIVMIEPGQTRTDLDIEPHEITSAKESGWFEIGGKLSDAAKKTADAVAAETPDAGEGVREEKTYTPQQIEELRDTARSLGLKPRANWDGEKLEKAIAEKQAAG